MNVLNWLLVAAGLFMAFIGYMALLVEEAFLGPKETKALLGMRMPLEYLYQEYLKKDTGLSNVLIDHMQDAAADEAGRQRKRNRERIAGEAR